MDTFDNGLQVDEGKDKDGKEYIEVHVYTRGSRQAIHYRFHKSSIVEETHWRIRIDPKAEPYESCPCPCPSIKKLVTNRQTVTNKDS